MSTTSRLRLDDRIGANRVLRWTLISSCIALASMTIALLIIARNTGVI